MIRAGVDADGPGFVRLINRCWRDYDDVADVEAEVPEIGRLASYYREAGGALWVAGEVDGMVAVRPGLEGAWEVCRMYVHPDHHGSGMGHALMDLAEGHAAAAGAVRLFLWSDTRFARAHRFYEKRGYVRGEQRVVRDVTDYEEWRFERVT